MMLPEFSELFEAVSVMLLKIAKKSIAVILAVLIVGVLLAPFCYADASAAGISAMVSSMSTEDKICQMLVLNFGTYADSSGHQTLSGAARQVLRDHCFGGVFFYAQNVSDNADTVRLIDLYQTSNAAGGSSRPQLLFAADQEGGSITRLGHGTQTPGNMALGAINSSSDARAVGQLIGSELSALGISVNFAPVLDVNNNPSNPVIGIRSFSDSAWMTASLGVNYLNGLKSTGTVGCLKHFPGHGDTSTDSHTGLPCINKTYAQLQSNELIPFQSAINAGAEMIMTAHIQFPQIETETYSSPVSGQTITLPATLSKKIITDILRGDMGFNGVVITDGMAMDALTAHFTPVEASRLAIEAGVDLLLAPVSPYNSSGISELENYIQSLVGMVNAGRISMDKIDAAVTRILSLKQRHGLLNRYDNSDLSARISSAVATVGSEAHHATEWEITKRAMTLVSNADRTLPLDRSSERTVILTASENEILSVEYAIALLRSEGKLAQGADVRVYTYDGRTYENLAAKINDADNVIAISEVKTASGLRSSTAQLIDRLIGYAHSKGARFIVLSAHLPYDAARFTAADAIMLAYSSKSMSEDPRVTEDTVAQYGPNIPAAIYMMFSTADSPTAKLPVNVPKLNSSFYFTNEILYARGYGLTYSSSPVQPTPAPTEAPSPTPEATSAPSEEPSAGPTEDITANPSEEPSDGPGGTETPGPEETPIPDETPGPEETEQTSDETTIPEDTAAPSDTAYIPEETPDGTSALTAAPDGTQDPGEPTGPSRLPVAAVVAASAAAVAVLSAAAVFVFKKKQ